MTKVERPGGRAADPVEHGRRARALEASGEVTAALEVYEAALRDWPDHPGLMGDLARLALRMGLPQAAEGFFRRILTAASSEAVTPLAIAAQDGLARALRDQHRYAEAIEVLRSVLMSDPQQPIVWNTLGTVLAQQGDSAAAITFFTEAVRLQPDFAQALYNLAGSSMDLGEIEAALQDCEAALALAEAEPPSKAGAETLAVMRFARATMLLCLGRLEEGWAAYRVRLDDAFPRGAAFEIAAPRWTPGHDLAGRAFLLVGEQGLGDEIMFATQTPDLLRALGPDGRLALAVEPRLVALFQRSFPEASVVAHATRTDVTGRHRRVPDLERLGSLDGWAPMADLLGELRPALSAFAPARPILKPDPALAAAWRERLAAEAPPGLKVGVTWRSGLLSGERRRHYAPLLAWAPVLETAGVCFVNLQYGECDAELDQLAVAAGLTLWRPPGLDLTQDLDGLAALACGLDLVVGCLNATINLAAACGIPTWVVAGPGAWPALGTGRLPWYGQTRLFQAPSFSDWAPALGSLATALADLTQSRRD